MTPQNDLDETLVTPRFDAAEEDAARPVELLAEVSRRARLNNFLGSQRRAFRRAWPLALALCLLTAVVVGGATALIHRQYASQQEAAQPVLTVAPTANLNQRANTPAPRAAQVAPTPHRARQAARPSIEYVITDETEASARDEEEQRDKEHKHKHKKHDGDEDEVVPVRPHGKKGKKGGAVLLDVIRDHNS